MSNTVWFREGDGPLRPMPGAPLTIVVPSPEVQKQLHYDGFVELDVCDTVNRCKMVIAFHPDTERLFRKVFPTFAGTVEPFAIRREGRGMQHVAGLIDLTLELQDRRRKVCWKYPESGLHPSAVVELADVLIELMQRGNSARP